MIRRSKWNGYQWKSCNKKTHAEMIRVLRIVRKSGRKKLIRSDVPFPLSLKYKPKKFLRPPIVAGFPRSVNFLQKSETMPEEISLQWALVKVLFEDKNSRQLSIPTLFSLHCCLSKFRCQGSTRSEKGLRRHSLSTLVKSSYGNREQLHKSTSLDSSWPRRYS